MRDLVTDTLAFLGTVALVAGFLFWAVALTPVTQ